MSSSKLVKSVAPIRTNILHVRSKDGTVLGSLNTSFKIDLLSAITADADEIILISMISASIPHSMYSVSAYLGNNTVIYDATQTLTVPTQFYDPFELIRQINADAAFNAIFSASYNLYTNKVTFLNTTVDPHTVEWSRSGLSNVLGYLNLGDEVVLGGSSTSGPDMLDLATIHSVIIRSSVAQGNVQSVGSGGAPVLQKINIDANPLEMIYLNATDILTVSLSNSPSISSIDFRLEDQNGNLLDLNERNFEMSIRFDIHQMVSSVNGGIVSPQQVLVAPPTPPTESTQPAPLAPVPMIRNPNQTIAEAIQGVNAFVPAPQLVPVSEERDPSAIAEETILSLLL